MARIPLPPSDSESNPQHSSSRSSDRHSAPQSSVSQSAVPQTSAPQSSVSQSAIPQSSAPQPTALQPSASRRSLPGHFVLGRFVPGPPVSGPRVSGTRNSGRALSGRSVSGPTVQQGTVQQASVAQHSAPPPSLPLPTGIIPQLNLSEMNQNVINEELEKVEKKRQQLAAMREQRRRLEADMVFYNEQEEKETSEMDQLVRRLQMAGVPASTLSGPASEPTTPPEYTLRNRDVFGDLNNNATGVTSSSDFFTAFAPSSTLTSPQGPSHQGHSHAQSVDRFAGFSQPTSRRNSELQDSAMDFTRASAGMRQGPIAHRFSLPSNNLSGTFQANPLTSNGRYGFDSPATKNIFDGTKHVPKDEDRMSTPDIKGYINMTEPDDNDAPRINNRRTPGPYLHNRRNRSAHQSMPQNFAPMRRDSFDEALDPYALPSHQPHHQPHRSLESGFHFPGEVPAGPMTPVPNVPRPVSLQSSYSTNDVPTARGMGFDTAITSPHARAGGFHQHSTSVGRIPGGTSQPHSSRNSPESNGNFLQPSALTYAHQPQQYSVSGNNGIPGVPVSMGNPFPNYPTNFVTAPYAPGGYSQPNFPAYPQNGHLRDPRIPGHRRGVDGSDPAAQQNRYNNTPIEQHIGEIYAMCKDQFGCRYLQRKLEERDPDVLGIIFNETFLHVTELMIDPFGNYLCQKLLEYSNDEQRTILINNAAPQLVEIALNQHGTRALQKMIEYVSTQEQIQTVVGALRGSVVDLVQDLNGNHVIQKCLNHLEGANAQFIYEAVGSHCVEVGTHRHGCCVIQRCIDHSTDDQRKRLIQQITANSIPLVQDPYGNYVVQYILDLGEDYYTSRVCFTFYGRVPQLSKQKFSSNVMEKCLRMATPNVRDQMIREVFLNGELDQMLRDSYANYVVQTAMEYADGDTRHSLHSGVRSRLNAIRNTPHGRRIATKLAGFDNVRAAQMARALAANGYQVGTVVNDGVQNGAPGGAHPSVESNNNTPSEGSSDNADESGGPSQERDDSHDGSLGGQEDL